MSRTIDADELIKFFPDKGEGAWTYNITAQGYINAMPTVDPWHYTSKRELPEKDGEYLCRYYKYDIRFSKVLLYRVKDNKWYNLVYDEEYRVPKPDAWQFIDLPKEEV